MVSDEGERETVETLAGLLEGIAIDEQINPAELTRLEDWLDAHAPILSAAVFVPLRERVEAALERGRLSAEEHAELLAYCHDFGAKHTPSHPSTREAFARLQGIALGLLADGRLDDEELRALRRWLADYEAYRQHFVFAAFFDALDAALATGKISAEARAHVRGLCETFGAPAPGRRLPPDFTPAPGPYDMPAAERRWPRLPDPAGADFVCLDLETANADPASVCAMGMASVRESEIEAGASLIDPGMNFAPRHVRLHGIGPKQVRGVGSFGEHWLPLAPGLAGAWLLAHNATFTARCLRALWPSLGDEAPAPPRLLCTLRLARALWPHIESHALEQLARTLGLTPPGHDPVAGARSCAELALRMCEEAGQPDPSALAAALGVDAISLL